MNRLLCLSTVACLSAAAVTVHAENADAASKHANACTRSSVGSPKPSVSQLEAMFNRPANAPDLLHNLKLAFDRDWLLQPSFYDDAILLKFFDGQRVVGFTQTFLHCMKAVVFDTTVCNGANPVTDADRIDVYLRQQGTTQKVWEYQNLNAVWVQL